VADGVLVGAAAIHAFGNRAAVGILVAHFSEVGVASGKLKAFQTAFPWPPCNCNK